MKEKINITNPNNLEEHLLSTVGKTIYKTFFKHYTIKQWGKHPKDLPVSTIQRIPIRFTYNNNYYTSKYQGIPVGGYTKIFQKLLTHPNIEVLLNTDYFTLSKDFVSQFNKIIYTGEIDRFFNYKLGKLEYRSLKFDHEYLLNVKDFQGNAVINYSDKSTPYTRIIEHKHFEFVDCPHTIITKEYSIDHTKDVDPYYPINDKKNNELYKKYLELKVKENKNNIYFCGRLGEYKYYSMTDTIQSVLSHVKSEFNK